MKLNIRKFAVATGISVGIVALSAGAAFAYWTATGTGTGTASTAAASQPLTVTGATFAGTALVPGGTAQDISATIANPNTFQVPVAGVTSVVTVDSAHATAGCLATWYSVTGLAASPTTVAASGTSTISGKVALLNDSTNQDACKSATITIAYTVTSS